MTATDTRVVLTAAALGTIRLHDPRHFTAYVCEPGDEGVIVDADSLPEGWLLVRLDEPDPEPGHPESDGHLYVPVHPSMIEPKP